MREGGAGRMEGRQRVWQRACILKRNLLMEDNVLILVPMLRKNAFPKT